MEVSNSGQALAFLGAAALGGGLGLLYDGCRLLRGRLGLPVLDVLLDLLYWPLTVLALFWHSVRLGDGVVRLYLLAGAVLGGVVYFLLFSGIVVYLSNRLADLAALLVLRPLRWGYRRWKKFFQRAKRVFHYEIK
jgi:hypothetical protein